ncbi:MAG TPA: TIGR00645 family protein [Candidatus Competibacteraceae bacterium]|nr:TIGR00645 family protein [Candidatus Competibacteraceae bacterium]HRY17570.1 TIGR00645 family protein [Candidatus Competibacteraceae bacterium]
MHSQHLPPNLKILIITMKQVEALIERIILLSRWLLAPLYLALIAVLVLFTVKAVQEAAHLFQAILSISETDLILSVLAMIDMVLVANLLVMVILSSYETFVSALDTTGDQEKPSWLGKIDAATIKIKLAVAIVAISSIHLLRAFMTAQPQNGDIPSWNNHLFWLVVIHLTFVVSALVMAFIDRIAFAQHRSH